MPYYQNALYGRGVPTYAEELSPLADVFKAFAPNPVRDVQLEGYVADTDLKRAKLAGLQAQQAGLSSVADSFVNDPQQSYVSAIRSGNTDLLKMLPEAVRGGYAAGGVSGRNVDQGTLANLMLGAGDDYARTQPGFAADQTRLNDNALMQSADRRYGDELASGDRRYGSDQSLAGVMYGADQRLIGTRDSAQIKSGGRGGAAAALKIDPVKLDLAIQQSLPGSFISDKGKVGLAEGLDPADLAHVRRLVADRIAKDPANQYGAIQQSITDVFGEAPQVIEPQGAVDNWGPFNTAAVPGRIEKSLPAAPMPTPAPAPAPVQNQAPVAISSPAELAALPPGTTYVAPDGSIRRKR
jgi:hypothetical protein